MIVVVRSRTHAVSIRADNAATIVALTLHAIHSQRMSRISLTLAARLWGVKGL